MLSRPPTSVLLTLLSVFFLARLTPTNAVKFALHAHRYPPSKCVWNAAHMNALVIVTANVAPGLNQRVDIEIIDSSPQRNVYLHKKNINGETRLAITSHAEGEVGVCFKNHLDHDASAHESEKTLRIIDLDVDIGADAVDYNAIANQESLSGLETEMRKLEGIVKEIVDEMDYLKKKRGAISNYKRIDKRSCTNFRMVHNCGVALARRVADNASARILQAQVLN